MLSILVVLSSLLMAMPIVAAKPTDQSIDLSVYADYAQEAWHVYISTMYDPAQQWIRLQANSKAPSNFWNAAVAYQSIMHYGAFNESINPNGGSTINDLIYQLLHKERTLGQSDYHLRNDYNDDGAWMIHGLTALYDRTAKGKSQGNVSLIHDALIIHDWIRESEDTTCCGSDKGGIWWDRHHTGKATASQAGSALAALRIAESGVKTMWTKEQWVNWAIVQYDFWRFHMVNSSTGQVCDSFDPKGNKHWNDQFTYNEGLMMGDCVHLYRATNDSRFIQDASMFVSRLMTMAQTVKIDGRQGLVLMDDRPTCGNDSSQFHQVAFQYMSEYYRVLLEADADPESKLPIDVKAEIKTIYQFLKDNVDSLWLNARDPKTGTFNCNWASQFHGKDNEYALQGSMNAALSALSLFAALPPPPGWKVINNINSVKYHSE